MRFLSEVTATFALNHLYWGPHVFTAWVYLLRMSTFAAWSLLVSINRDFNKDITFAIMPILASEVLLCENKKIQ